MANIKISTVVQNIKTWAEGLSWTSDSGGGTTEFKAVYTYANWKGISGYPFLVVEADLAEGRTLSNKFVEFNHDILLHMCGNWAKIDKQTDDEKKEEMNIRALEIWDYLRTQIVLETTETTFGVDFIINPGLLPLSIPQFNIIGKTLSITLKEPLSRI